MPVSKVASRQHCEASLLPEDFLGEGNRGYRAGPASLKCQLDNSLSQLVLCHAIFVRSGEAAVTNIVNKAGFD